MSLEMSQDVGRMDALYVYKFVSRTDKIPRTRERPSELWLVFLNRKLRSASKKGGLAYQRRLICIGGESTLGLVANGRLGRAPRDIREVADNVIGIKLPSL